MALEMLEMSKCALHGRTTRTQPAQVSQQPVELPKTTLECHSNVESSADVMFVNRGPVLVAASTKHIHHATANAVEDLKMLTLDKTLQTVFNCCRVQGST